MTAGVQAILVLAIAPKLILSFEIVAPFDMAGIGQ
jgi:hypothetical protein